MKNLKKLTTLWVSAFLFIIFHFNGHCQKKDNNFIIKLNTTSLVDITSFPSIQFALEKKINKYFSVQTEFGYQLYNFNVFSTDTSFVKPSGFRAFIELRLNKDIIKIREVGFYTGVNLFYRKFQYNYGLSYYEDSLSTLSIGDSFWVKKRCFGGNIICGIQKEINSSLLIDTYIGLGIMDRKILDFNREYDESKHLLDLPQDLSPGWNKQWTLREGSGIRPNFLLGLRICYRLK